MGISKIRKTLQNELKRKFMWIIRNGCRTTDVTLTKVDASREIRYGTNDEYVTDLSIRMSRYQTVRNLQDFNKDTHEISLYLNQYQICDKNAFLTMSNLVTISFEELELIYNILRQAREEIKEDISK